MIPWLLRSRITPPKHMHQIIARKEVDAQLNACGPLPVAILEAPPGYGKSAALESWTRDLGRKGISTAWLTLHGSDDLDVLLRYLAFSLAAQGLGVHSTGLLDSEQSICHPVRSLQCMLACIERSGTSWMLVLDDADRISSRTMSDFVEPIAKFLPTNLGLVFAGQDCSSLPVEELRRRTRILCVRPEHLRFSREEIREVFGRRATPSQVQAVQRITAGWPILVQLVRQHGMNLHYPGLRPDIATNSVSCFFEKALLSRLTVRECELAMELALLGQFTQQFAERLLEVATLPQAILSLTRFGILISEDAKLQARQFSIFPLLREYLAERLAALQPDAASQIHRRAAYEYSRRGDYVNAVLHARAVGDEELIGDVVEAVDPIALWIKKGISRSARVVHLIPDTLARRRPRVGYALVASMIKAGRLKKAQALFDEIEPAFATAERQHASVSSIHFERAMCHSLLAVYKGTPIAEEDINAFDRLVVADTDIAQMVLSFSETMRSFVRQQTSHFADAVNAARKAIAHAERGQSPYGAFFMYCDLAMIAGLQGRPLEAKALFSDAERLCQEAMRCDPRLTFVRDAFRLELAHELDPLNMSDLARLKNICVRLPKLEGWLDVFAAAYRTYSEKLWLRGDLRAALTVLAMGIDHLTAEDIQGAATVLGAQEALLLARNGQATAAADKLERITDMRTFVVSDERPWRVTEAVVEAWTAIQIARGDYRVGSLLKDAIRFSDRTQNVRSEVRYLRLYNLLRQSKAPRLSRDLRLLRTLEHQSGFSRSAHLYGKARNSVPRPSNHRGEVYGQPCTRTGYLTDREQEVLSGVRQRLSDKAIALKLGITAHGVRYHLKQVNAKLHAKSRFEALQKADLLGTHGNKFPPTNRRSPTS